MTGRGKGPTARVKITFATIAETRDRIAAAAKQAGTDVESVIAEALYVHLHRLETSGKRAYPDATDKLARRVQRRKP